MKSIGIVADSHSSISQSQAQELGIYVLPMPFYINDECYYEDISLSREEFFQKLAEGASVTTSQPSPQDVTSLWDEALAEYESIIYIPISSGLSGSCNTAKLLAQEPPYASRVFVVDNGRVSTPMHCTILDALELRKQGLSAKEIADRLEEYRDQMVIYIGVETLEYLKKGGRINATTASIGGILNIKPVLKLFTGNLDSYAKCRGFQKAKRTMLEAMENDLQTVFKEPWEQGRVHLLAASSATPEVTEKWVAEIQEHFPNTPVLSGPLSLGVCCHIGPGGLGIGCSVKPYQS